MSGYYNASECTEDLIFEFLLTVVMYSSKKLHTTKEELQEKKSYIESVEPQLAHGGQFLGFGSLPSRELSFFFFR